MPTFRYQTSSHQSNGALLIDAPDRAAAVRLLVERGEAPVRIEEVAAGTPTGREGSRFTLARRRTLSRAQLGMFIRELATAVSAGLPLVPALRTIARQAQSPGHRAMLAQLIDDVEHGRSLSGAMQRWGAPFNDLIVGLVNAGEVAGRLPEVLTQSARLLERDAKLRSMLLSSMLYPAIIASAVAAAVVIVVTVIVPRVLAAVAGQLAVLPLPTRIIQSLAHLVGSWWWLILLILGFVAWAASRWYRRPGPRLAVDRALLRLPAVGPALRDVAVARFTRTLGTLVAAGLPIVQSLRITRNVLGNRAMELALDEVCEQVSAGKTIAEPMERSGLFPPLLVQIVGMGEQTGRLDDMLTQAADAFEDRTEQSIKTLTTILPPLLIVLLACVVGFVVLSILLPLIELQESIG